MLCRLFGYTRQGYWKQTRKEQSRSIDASAVLNEVKRIRTDMPRMGVRKLQVKLQEDGHRIGRDRLYAILGENGMLVKRKRTRAVTTYSKHWLRKYPNLIKGMEPDRPDQIWVSDITYITIEKPEGKSFLYLSLITDAYTHEIEGYCLHDSLGMEGPIAALSMALSSHTSYELRDLIHHSDRGCQYCSHDYVNQLKANGILVSMTEKGDPYENAIAERVNGILKTEWLNQEKFTSAQYAKERIARIIHFYNYQRPHMSVGNLTPVEARRSACTHKKLWKNYWREKVEKEKYAALNALSEYTLTTNQNL